MTENQTKRTKPSLTPVAYLDHDDKDYYVQIELPGIKKEDIELTVSDQSFCIRAEREDVVYLGCYVLAHFADTGKVKTKFLNGLLNIMIPLKKLKKGTKVKID